MVVANPGVSEMTGWPIGFWASELVHPWYEFREAGHEVVVASPDGGEVSVDTLSDPRDESGYSADDVLSRGFLDDRRLTAMLEDTPRLADLDLVLSGLLREPRPRWPGSGPARQRRPGRTSVSKTCTCGPRT